MILNPESLMFHKSQGKILYVSVTSILENGNSTLPTNRRENRTRTLATRPSAGFAGSYPTRVHVGILIFVLSHIGTGKNNPKNPAQPKLCTCPAPVRNSLSNNKPLVCTGPSQREQQDMSASTAIGKFVQTLC